MRDDDGFSLVEVLVSMGILTVVTLVAMSGLVQIYSATQRVDSTSTGRDELGTVYRRLDREIRYANWMDTPGQVGNRWYVEYAVGTTGCRQLAYSGGVLSIASWSLPGTTPGAATPLANDLQLIGSTPPFTVFAPGTKPYATASAGTAGVGAGYITEFSQIRLQFNASVGKTTQPFDSVFTAQNTSRNTADNANDCSKGRPTV